MSRLLSILSITFFLTACGGSASAPEPSEQEAEAKLLRYVKQALANPAQSQNMITAVDGIATAESGGSNKGIPASSTNLQESGVDELDRLKLDTDKKVMYSIYSQKLHVTQMDNEGKNLTKLQVIDTEATLKGLYLYSEKVAAIRSGDYDVWNEWHRPGYFGGNQFGVNIYQKQANGQLETTPKTFDFEGTLIASRSIGNQLYLVLRHFPKVTYNEDHRINTEALTVSDILPDYQRNQQGKQPSVKASDCVINDNGAFQHANVINIVRLDLSQDAIPVTSQCYLGDADALYASQQALYLAASEQSYRIENGRPLYQNQTRTHIHKFAFAESGIEYRGSGTVDGHLGWAQHRKSFRMSEHDGHLRVLTVDEQRLWLATVDVLPATSNTQQGTPPNSTSPVKLSILKESENQTALEIVSTLPNKMRPTPLGKANEDLYASHFMGDKGYLVTFKIIDPLYVLNLSDPSNPFIEGELEIEGYSDYLYPLGNDLLLGVGKDAVADQESTDWGGAWYQGIKLSLIDVANPNNPQEIDRIILGKRGSDSPALRNHHSYNQLKIGKTARFTLPISVHETPSSYQTGSASDYYELTYGGLFKFEVDLEQKTLSQTGAIRIEKEDAQKPLHIDNRYARSRMIGDQLHYLYQDRFYSQDWQAQAPISILK